MEVVTGSWKLFFDIQCVGRVLLLLVLLSHIGWITEQTDKAVKSLSEHTPLSSGLFVPRLSPEALANAIEASLEGGANGVSLFSARAMTAAHWQSFSRAIKR